MNILAIETSCDETAAAVVSNGRTVRSSIVSSQIDIHAATGGVVPEVAARLQTETIQPVVAEALEAAGINWPKVDAIAVTQGPGLIGSLLVGVETAKALAYAKELPLIPVNHLAGHLYACLAGERTFRFPYVGLVVSGGHTELVLMTGHHEFALLGSTRDDAAGEAFDKVGKLLGLPYPAGPPLSAIAEEGDSRAIDFPIAMSAQDTLDFSFSGLKTAVRRELESGRPTKKRRADIAASFERAVVEALVVKTTAAVRRLKPSALLLGGGVAANKRLRKELTERTSEKLLATPPEYATDNAAMIGMAAYWSREQAITGKARLAVSADPSLALADG